MSGRLLGKEPSWLLPLFADQCCSNRRAVLGLWLSLLQTVSFLRKLAAVLLHYFPADKPGTPEFKAERQVSDSELSMGWSLVAAYPSAPVLQSERERRFFL